jgi:hypothetical protein
MHDKAKEKQMYLFSRTRTADPTQMAAALAWAPEVAQYVTKITGLTILPWAAVYGAPLGALSWSTRVESQTEMAKAQGKLADDSGYQKLVADGLKYFSGPVEDSLTQFVHMEGTPNSAKFAEVVRAQCAPGRIADAMSWGVDMTKYVAKLSGLPTSMVRTMYGPWAGLGWIALADDLAQIDNAEAVSSVDPSYIERIDSGGELFIAGTAVQILLRSLA